MDTCLEGEPAAFGVAHFVQVGVTGELDHGRWSTHEDESVVAGGRQMVPHHVFTDEALAVLPVWNTETHPFTQLTGGPAFQSTAFTQSSSNLT